jgi:glycosyltransferase involved in cell wall biosynthesis
VILEALSFGLPIIAVKSGPICELVKNDVNGLLSENIEADFFQKIKCLIHNEILLDRLKTKENEKLKELSISNQCMKLLNYYNQVIEEKKK